MFIIWFLGLSSLNYSMPPELQQEVDEIESFIMLPNPATDRQIAEIQKRLNVCAKNLSIYLNKEGHDEVAESRLEGIRSYIMLFKECHKVFTGEESLASENAKRWIEKSYVYELILRR